MNKISFLFILNLNKSDMTIRLKKMDTSIAIANLVPGNEVAAIARCIDTLLQSDYYNSEVFIKLLPFLGKDLLEKKIIDFSAEPGVDITDRYFVLWEPFLRAKTALLIATIVEKCDNVEKVSELVPFLIDMFLSEEEIEQCFSLIAISNIGLRLPNLILPHFPKLVKPLTSLISLASAPSKPFCLYHSRPFQSQVFESFIDFCSIQGIFEPQNISRFVEANLPISLVQISLSTPVYIEKKSELQWKIIYVYLRLITEHPQGINLFDIDRIPSNSFDLCNLMRYTLTNKEFGAKLRIAIDSIPSNQRTGQGFIDFCKKYKI